MDSKIRKIKNLGHLLLAVSANAIYGFPSHGMKIIGVTGTDGKTTTSTLIYHILKESGQKVALISTIGANIDGTDYDTGFHVTTPSYFQVQKFLKIAKKKKCTYAVVEVTSHALDQNRVFGLKFDIGVLTNITNEHLNYHKSYENYVHTKLKLLKNSKVAVVNSTGDWYPFIQREILDSKIITYSLKGNLDKDVSENSLPFEIKTKLLGDFNRENILAAICACLELGVLPNDIEKAIENFSPPKGRQQIIENSKVGMIMIDFAHTPGAFERILPEVRYLTKGRLIHVFGSAGQRDSNKRSDMGKISSEFADIIILTAEDPRGEQILKINGQIKSGIDESFEFKNRDDEISKKTVFEISDRKEAIEYAIFIAGSKDTVLITGKGHERSMNYGHGEIPWSDEEVVREYIANG